MIQGRTRAKNKGRAPGHPQPARREYNRPPKHKFVMGLADLIAIPNISARLKAPKKVGDKVLGPKPDAWCEFHQGFGHTVDSCLALGYQLDDLVNSGFLNDYLLDRRKGGASSSQPAGGEAQQHEMPPRDPHHCRRFLGWWMHRVTEEEVCEVCDDGGYV